MSIYLTVYVLFFIHILSVKVHIKASGQNQNINDSNTTEDATLLNFIHENGMKFLYSNSDLGHDNTIILQDDNLSAIRDYWKYGLPLKVTTHGWHPTTKKGKGVFMINTAYIDLGGFNIMMVDWSVYANSMKYPIPAVLTKPVGFVMAKILDDLINITGILASDIHLLGHSLGAHVVGACGSQIKSGKVGRITGLDPAKPGFQSLSVHTSHLSIEDAQFVDIVHTSAGMLGYSECLGHVDFFPNSGKAPQPGCHSVIDLIEFSSCSHARSYELYADSVVHRNSLIGVNCSSWKDYKHGKCDNELHTPMGHDVSLSARGNFYLKTKGSSPFGTT